MGSSSSQKKKIVIINSMIKFLIISIRKTLKINWEIKATAKPLIEILSYQNALIVNHCKSLTCMGPMDKIIIRDTFA